MKVITKTIADKIDEAIDKHGKDIVRIELTNSEFERLLISGREFEYTEVVVHYPANYSGSYVKYRGVCIQTHSSYFE